MSGMDGAEGARVNEGAQEAVSEAPVTSWTWTEFEAAAINGAMTWAEFEDLMTAQTSTPNDPKIPGITRISDRMETAPEVLATPSEA